MIVSIEGRLEKAGPLSAVISSNGIGYLVTVPITTASKLPQIGATVKLHTRAVYREDTQALYGFSSENERDFFSLVVDKVSGVGPKVAISLMSKLDLESLASAIASENAALIAKTPGIGKKTAERIVIELKDKTSHIASGSASPSSSPLVGIDPTTTQSEQDAILALSALGYKTADASKSVKAASKKLGPNVDTEELIRAALK